MKIKMSLSPYKWEKRGYPLGIPIVIVWESTGRDKQSIWNACDAILQEAESYKNKCGAVNYIIPGYDCLHRTDTYYYKEKPFLVWRDIGCTYVGARILFQGKDERPEEGFGNAN